MKGILIRVQAFTRYIIVECRNESFVIHLPTCQSFGRSTPAVNFILTSRISVARMDCVC
jgi:hypothetical protein